MKDINQKKGFLLAEETLKIILAIIAIGFLVYLLYSLYASNRDSKNLELAKESLNFLFNEMNAQKINIDIYNPSGWSILSWPFENKMPLTCSNLGWSNCVCICKKPIIATFGNYLDNCNDAKKSICKESSFKIISSENIQLPIIIENPPITLNVNYQNKIISKE